MANRLAYLGLGAALMYFYDPQAGRKRRADLQNRIDATGRQLAHARDVVRRDAANRMNGLAAESRGIIEAGKRDGLKAGGTSLWRWPRAPPARGRSGTGRPRSARWRAPAARYSRCTATSAAA